MVSRQAQNIQSKIMNPPDQKTRNPPTTPPARHRKRFTCLLDKSYSIANLYRELYPLT